LRGGTKDGQSIGAAPRGNNPGRRDREREDGSRPDFLIEDEETWTTARRNIVPPVVE